VAAAACFHDALAKGDSAGALAQLGESVIVLERVVGTPTSAVPNPDCPAWRSDLTFGRRGGRLTALAFTRFRIASS